jgi:hypothetical protein
MDISKVAKKPQLVEVTIDDEDIVNNYGETISFWMMDFVDINTYFDFFKSQNDKNGEHLNRLLKQIILKADGTPALTDDEGLPIDISIAALTKINETLGKSKTKPSTQNSGTQPE